jgi:hypothetical protein
VSALIDGVVQPGGIPEIELLQRPRQLIAVVGEGVGMKLDLVVERADHPLVDRQHAHDELLRSVLYEVEGQRHAAAGVEHHDHRDRRGFVGERRDGLELAVIVDLEVVLREAGHEPLLGVDHGDVQGHALGRDADRLRCRREREQDERRSKCETAFR